MKKITYSTFVDYCSNYCRIKQQNMLIDWNAFIFHFSLLSNISNNK